MTPVILPSSAAASHSVPSLQPGGVHNKYVLPLEKLFYGQNCTYVTVFLEVTTLPRRVFRVKCVPNSMYASVMCHIACVIYKVSYVSMACVICHMSYVICHLLCVRNHGYLAPGDICQ